LVKEQDGSLKF
jgi:tetratricopeptide (TPR) repeat protein